MLGNVTLSASTTAAGGGGVQFLVDGNVVGSASSSPYSFSWNSTTVVDGEHWVAARTTDAQGRTNTTTTVALNVSNSTPPPVPGLLAIDATKSVDGRGAVTTPALGASETGDLLLAFVSSDGPSGAQTATVSGGGLTWSLVRRANTRLGTSEIWKATAPASAAATTVTSTQSRSGYDQSLTVIAFAGAGGVGASNGAGAATGAPRTTLTTTGAGSWVFGAGNDWDGATARTLGAGQSMRHQWLDTGSGDTFWAQSQTSPTPAAGTVVAIDDTAPTNHQWNLAAVEVLSGSQSPPPPDTTAPQVTVTDPKAATTVSGIVALGATASDNVGVTSVQFKVDGQPVGAPDTAPPFQGSWDTRTATAGSHTVTAEASDAAGNTGASRRGDRDGRQQRAATSHDRDRPPRGEAREGHPRVARADDSDGRRRRVGVRRPRRSQRRRGPERDGDRRRADMDARQAQQHAGGDVGDLEREGDRDAHQPDGDRHAAALGLRRIADGDRLHETRRHRGCRGRRSRVRSA